MADRVGQQLDNYRLVRLLGAGGFGEVYLAEHIYRKTQVAIKVLHTRLSQEDLLILLRETRNLLRLKQHPNIVQIIDFNVESSPPFIVTEYAPSGTLRQRHPKGTQVPLPIIVSYVKQVAGALQYAHDERLIHRDVKPENMLIGAQNQVLLSDFGIAVVAHTERSLTTQEMAGTIPYMAPEQIRGLPRPASDQYALGIVVYEWLSGIRPFQGSQWEIIDQKLSVPPSPLREKVPTASSKVEQVVMKALAKEPEQRFRNVLAFANALEQASQPKQPGSMPIPEPEPVTTDPSQFQLSQQITVSADPANISSQQKVSEVSEDKSAQPHDIVPRPSQVMSAPASVYPPMPSPQQGGVAVSQRGPEPVRRGISRRTMVLGLGLAGLAVAGGGIAWLAFSRGLFSTFTSGQTPTPVPTPSPTPIPLGSVLYTYGGHSAIVLAVAWSPDGKRIASGSFDKTVQVWNAADGGHAFTYRGHSVPVNAVAWSLDGRRIASGSNDKTVQVWDAADGSHVFTYRGHADVVLAVAWSPDGRHIASGSVDKTVQVWDAADGSHVFTYQGHADVVDTVVWSSDGTRIASGSYDKTVQVWDAADGSHGFTYRGHAAIVHAVAWSPDGKRIASGSDDKTVQVWNAADGGNVFTYKGHSNLVEAVAWSPNGKRIASGSFDKTVQVWDAADGSHVFTYQGHSDVVDTVVWSSDGKRIASGSYDKTVQVWWGAG